MLEQKYFNMSYILPPQLLKLKLMLGLLFCR